MATSDTKNTRRLTDWIILVFVLIVMGLLVADLSDNVRGEADRHGSTPQGPDSVDIEMHEASNELLGANPATRSSIEPGDGMIEKMVS